MHVMKAIVYEKFGGPEVLHVAEMPVPEPRAGEVQVRVEAAGLNPVDGKMRAGLFPSGERFPKIPLRDFAGEVTALGSGVTQFQVGEKVYGVTGNGSAAEYTIASPSAMAARPSSLNAVEAAAVPLASMTAWQALFDHGHLVAGERVLIHAAAGGVGTFAVQFAKWKGAFVIGTASSANHAMLRDLGADELIDYASVDFSSAVSNVDLVLFSIGPSAMTGSLKVLRRGGRLVSITVPPDASAASALGVTATHMVMQPSSAQLAEIASLIDQGVVKVLIDETFPLEKVQDAMRELEEGHTVGKIAVRVSLL